MSTPVPNTAAPRPARAAARAPSQAPSLSQKYCVVEWHLGSWSYPVLCELLHCMVLYKKVYICIWLLLLFLSFAVRQVFFNITPSKNE